MTATSTAHDSVEPDGSGGSVALSPEVARFLLQFSIALHKAITYPQRHPALESAVQLLLQRLDPLFASTPSLSIGVGRDQLLVGEGTTDPSNAVLRGLAGVLHRHQIAALDIEAGTSAADLTSLLEVLAEDTRSTPPLGARGADAIAQWPHIEIVPVRVDRLQISDHCEDFTHARQLWMVLAAEALSREPAADLEDATPVDIARAIRENVGDEEYNRRIAAHLLELGRELVDRDGVGSPIAVALGNLVRAIGDDELRALLETGSDLEVRRKLTRNLSRVVPAGAALALTVAAADASKQVISHSLLRMFTKMATNADERAGSVSAAADSELRDAILSMVDGWTLEDPNPAPYHAVLSHLTESSGTGDADHQTAPGSDALRVVDVAVDADAVGPIVWRAIDEIVELGRLGELLDILADPSLGTAARRIRAYLARPELIRALLRTQQDRRVVDYLLGWTGLEAADALLDSLETADSRAVRRLIMARLVQLGETLAPRVIERLETGPWYVQRNMLYLLSEMPGLPDDFSPARWIESDDVRIRREAVRVGLAVEATRDRAIEVGIADGYTRNLGPVLSAAAVKCPPGIARALITLLGNLGPDSALRGQAIHVLGRTGTREARKWLLEVAVGRKRWWRRRSLRPRSKDTVHALSALRSWRTQRDVAAVLSLARQSEDPEIRQAASGSGEAL